MGNFLFKARIIKNGVVRRFNEKQKNRSVLVFVWSVLLYGFSYDEFFNKYKLHNLPLGRIKEFVSFYWMKKKIYDVFNNSPDKELFNNKKQFLETFHNFVHRKWYDIQNVSKEQFDNIVVGGKLLYKPLDSCCGNGICLANNVDYHRINGGLLEELICDYNEVLQSFHPYSLNTIRVLSIQNNGKCKIIGCILRVGVNGSIVDNASAGGIFASIGIEDGVIDSDGFDKQGNCYEEHPNSHIRFKGGKIPAWENIKQTVTELSKVVPSIHVVGWDICLMKYNQIEVIEGNVFPDVDFLQQPKQLGIKPVVKMCLKELSLV